MRNFSFSVCLRFHLLGATFLCATLISVAQTSPCRTASDRPLTPTEQAYANADYASAESLATQALAQHPQDASISEALVRTLLREGKLDQAITQANSALIANPQAAASLTAKAEIDLRQGQPWSAMQSLDAAIGADPCYAPAHLIRAKALRIDSMYASERAEIQKAYAIDPIEPDIQAAWNGIVHPAQEIESVQQSLSTMKDIDPETRHRAEENANSMLPLLYENSQTCKVLPTMTTASVPLLPSRPDPKHIDGYKVEVQLPQSDAKLLVDTAGSGIYISRAVADANGLKPDPNDPPGTVHLNKLRVGPLEFGDCIVGVSDAPFAGKGDGSIGADIFASYIISLDFKAEKMTLEPLPAKPGLVPGDRLNSPELAGFEPVYHRRQYLLVPIEFNNKARKLFILASGMRFSAMTSDAAHSVSKMTMNFTNTEQTATGTKVQFFRDTFDMQLTNLPLLHQSHILELDPAVINRNAGFQIAGMLGLDVLGPLTLHLDYRDGLVKFDTVQQEVTPLLRAKNAPPAATQIETSDCLHYADSDIPITSTVQATVTGALSSAHLKPGKEVWVKATYGWEQPDCRIEKGSILYGHVTNSESSKDPASAELSILFDHADCVGHDKKPVQLQLIGLVAAPDASEPIFGSMPSEVAGGARQISDLVAATNAQSDNLNPGGRPNTVRPGVVLHMPKIKLEPTKGPGCSDRITSTNRSVELGPGAQLILLIKSMPQ